ncbi:hypothetical protein TMatcc_004355 [Talaromyces marneffei ATCC 18224]|uniref:Tat pathway signal sequence n=2 Tax=Talaromyces marneffei TaxID=37727 RepID=B6Q517_TALMQ|nr:uncharacterized protein EYB26_000691 [Talaromyces marneffei]EEA27360.1 conserved hypothetical protein [Talaromyces marneffei ATCC 18224]QGA13046.1 hypothetical protein EYB26_000691 [Talaromyces marneffei]
MAFERTRKLFNRGYSQVSDNTTSHSEPDVEDEQGLLSREKSCNCSLKRDANATLITPEIKQGVLISVWLSVVCIALVMIVTSTLRKRHSHAIDDMCFEHSTYYSPLIQDIDTTPRLVTTNGSLNWPSVYRQPPGPEVDEAWDEISYNMGVFALPEEIALKAGLHKGDVRIPAGYQGSGDYMASLEVTHQLHCVNFLRKAVWFNYPHYKDNNGDEFRDPQHVLEMHLYHCLETLRQSIMCHADPGIVGYKFVRGREHRPYPDFNTPHKCRDWRGMVDWAYRHSVPGHPEEMDFVPGKDEIVYDVDP